MKKLMFAYMLMFLLLGGCSAIQSIVRSTFPYTAILGIPPTSATTETHSAIAQASSFDQVFTGQGSNTKAISGVHLSALMLEATNPSGQSLGLFKSIKIYILRGDSVKEQLIATRTDIASTVGNKIMLDANTTLILDEYIKESSVRIRMEYVLNTAITTNLTLKANLSFETSPKAIQ